MTSRLYGILLMLLLVFTCTFLSSCIISDKYGRLSINLSKRTGVTIEYLLEHWNDYEVFYAGVHEGVPSALTFDPKDDDKKLTFHEWWTRVKSKKQLKAQIISLLADRPEPVLWEILGPKNAIFGYMYTPYNSVYMRVVDQNTLWIDEMTIQLQNYRLYYFGGF